MPASSVWKAVQDPGLKQTSSLGIFCGRKSIDVWSQYAIVAALCTEISTGGYPD